MLPVALCLGKSETVDVDQMFIFYYKWSHLHFTDEETEELIFPNLISGVMFCIE